MMVMMMVMVIMVLAFTMMMMVMLHRHRFGRRRGRRGLGQSGEGRQGESGSQDGRGEKCFQHCVSFRESFRPAREGRPWSGLETHESGMGSSMIFCVIGFFRPQTFHSGLEGGFSVIALSTDCVSAA